MFNIGMGELLVVVIVALFVFGPEKFPQAARAAGKGVREFRKAMRTVAEEMQAEEIQEVKQTVQKDVKEIKDMTMNSNHAGGSHGTNT